MHTAARTVLLALAVLPVASWSFSATSVGGIVGHGTPPLHPRLRGVTSASRVALGRSQRSAPRMAAEGAKGKVPVILCPAQFGTPADYTELVGLMEQRGFAVYPAPLSRFDWLKIVPSTLTKEFLTAELRPAKTLGFFYEAITKALEEVDRVHGSEEEVVFLGHSIGGWVARSYIGEKLGEEGSKRVRSLVTLGTPNNAPPKDSPVALLDQTRGLLTYINAQFPSGAPLPASRVACVAGSGTQVPESLGEIFGNAGDKLWDAEVGRSKLLEEVVAFSSYLPLSGSALGVKGDGLIPIDTALIGGECRSVVLEDCNHAGFVPTPGPSLMLPKSYLWYGSEELIDQWIQLL
mmetsp:Transcript_13908/g.27474  ORF Transcript_13908/g.27474 Transcript_13908/m.27474 type:complete len:349 (-) Transcript_13908:29-1075(-)